LARLLSSAVSERFLSAPREPSGFLPLRPRLCFLYLLSNPPSYPQPPSFPYPACGLLRGLRIPIKHPHSFSTSRLLSAKIGLWSSFFLSLPPFLIYNKNLILFLGGTPPSWEMDFGVTYAPAVVCSGIPRVPSSPSVSPSLHPPLLHRIHWYSPKFQTPPSFCASGVPCSPSTPRPTPDSPIEFNESED